MQRMIDARRIGRRERKPGDKTIRIRRDWGRGQYTTGAHRRKEKRRRSIQIPKSEGMEEGRA
eukprot:2859539-Pyramimonas_sp.AAC.1